MRAGLIEADSNPVALTLRHPEKARSRTLTDDELRAIWAATEGDGDYARIVRLCILTGSRRKEIGGLSWDEILADRLVIGEDRMKAGTAHEIPVLPMIMAALPSRPERSPMLQENSTVTSPATFPGVRMCPGELTPLGLARQRKMHGWTIYRSSRPSRSLDQCQPPELGVIFSIKLFDGH
jgi:integrase